jgi:hypothetical protein
MALYSLARFRVRADARMDAEKAMFEHTSTVRQTLPDVMVTIYRDPEQPARYTAMVRADAAKAEAAYRDVLRSALAAHVDGEIEFEHSELVTSSDLQRRRR